MSEMEIYILYKTFDSFDPLLHRIDLCKNSGNDGYNNYNDDNNNDKK